MLYTIELNLATEKQKILDLKAELERNKEVAQLAREAVEAIVEASYECGVLDTEKRLAEEVTVVCRDYVIKSWGVGMDRVGVPVDFELRRVENIFFLEDIREAPDMVLPIEQLPTT